MRWTISLYGGELRRLEDAEADAADRAQPEALPSSAGLTQEADGTWTLAAEADELVLPDRVRRIGCDALRGMAFRTVRLPEGLEAIRDRAFRGCRNLTEIRLPDSLLRIGREAFADCVSLRRVHLPARTALVHPDSFRGCTALEAFSADPANPKYSAPGGFLCSRDGTELLAAPDRETLTVPEGVRLMGPAVLSSARCRTLILPESLTQLEMSAISCPALRELRLPARLERLKCTLPRVFCGDELRDLFFRGPVPGLEQLLAAVTKPPVWMGLAAEVTSLRLHTEDPDCLPPRWRAAAVIGFAAEEPECLTTPRARAHLRWLEKRCGGQWLRRICQFAPPVARLLCRAELIRAEDFDSLFAALPQEPELTAQLLEYGRNVLGQEQLRRARLRLEHRAVRRAKRAAELAAADPAARIRGRRFLIIAPRDASAKERAALRARIERSGGVIANRPGEKVDWACLFSADAVCEPAAAAADRLGIPLVPRQELLQWEEENR